MRKRRKRRPPSHTLPNVNSVAGVESDRHGNILVISPPWCEYPDQSAPLVPRLGHRDTQENGLSGCEGNEARYTHIAFKLLDVYQQLFNMLTVAIRLSISQKISH
ncbi:hypothetical protein EVAR_46855_1 [Eumeta japonica]|uniref:Uncharacterized protein n=1 Tax=Eumeta variegata TaxID=151549 RepID=A0A4C1XMP0_EUMVA|nr:hypothetical protein EVAR_46855_1 [Eumeta japonica]